MNGPRISIITVVKNGMPYLIDCLKSFQLQNYSNKEHIIIYSNSDDGTKEFLLSKKNKIQKQQERQQVLTEYAELKKSLKKETRKTVIKKIEVKLKKLQKQL